MSTVRDYLYDTRARHGRIDIDIIHEEARDPDCPMHDRLNWDDTHAAELYRKEQIRDTIRSFRVTYVEATEKRPARSVREFISVPDDTGQNDRRYEPTTELDETQRAVLLLVMEREWKSLKARYAHMQEFLDLVQNDIAA